MLDVKYNPVGFRTSFHRHRGNTFSWNPSLSLTVQPSVGSNAVPDGGRRKACDVSVINSGTRSKSQDRRRTLKDVFWPALWNRAPEKLHRPCGRRSREPRVRHRRIADPGQTSARVCIRFRHEERFACGLCDTRAGRCPGRPVCSRGNELLRSLDKVCERWSRMKMGGLAVRLIEQPNDQRGRRQNRCVPDLLRRPTTAHDVGTDEEPAGSVVAIVAGNSDEDVRIVGIRIADGSRAVFRDGDKSVL